MVESRRTDTVVEYGQRGGCDEVCVGVGRRCEGKCADQVRYPSADLISLKDYTSRSVLAASENDTANGDSGSGVGSQGRGCHHGEQFTIADIFAAGCVSSVDNAGRRGGVEQLRVDVVGGAQFNRYAVGAGQSHRRGQGERVGLGVAVGGCAVAGPHQQIAVGYGVGKSYCCRI